MKDKKNKLTKKTKGLMAVFSILAIVGAMIFGITASANTVKIKESGMQYWHAHKNSGGSFTRYGQFGDWQTVDGNRSYCIAPGETFQQSHNYNTYELEEVTMEELVERINSTNSNDYNTITLDQLKKMALYAYYGEGYGNHTGNKWVAATQMLIWREIDAKQVFVNTLCTPGNTCYEKGDATVGLTDEMNEIKELVDNHSKRPSFDKKSNYKLNIGQSIQITDTNNVLSQFKVDKCTNCTASINGNVLTLTATSTGNVEVSLKKDLDVYPENMYLALSGTSQNQIVRGNLDPVTAKISGKSFGGDFELFKTSIQDGKPVANAEYSVKNASNEVVCTIKTDANGYGKCTNLEAGTYKIKETKAPQKFKLDPKTYTVTLSASNPTDSIEVEDSYITGKVKVVKKDAETRENKPQGGASLEGARYCVYDEAKKLVDTLITDKEGKATSKDLIYGHYTMQECKTPEGYGNDSTIYPIVIDTEDQEPIEIESYDPVIKHKFDLVKAYTNTTGVGATLQGEKGAKFDIHLVKDGKRTKVATLVTDDDGKANITLPYGLYEVTQTLGIHGHFLVDTFTIDLRDKDVSKILNNEPVTAKLKVVKVDSTNGKRIPLKGVTFKIKNKDTDEYVCQAVTYPTTEKICEFKTDENGIMTTPKELSPGNYIIEEADIAMHGYLWNQRTFEFEIGHNTPIEQDIDFGPIFEVRFENTPVMGKVNVKKNGEKIVFKDNTYYYDQVPLKDVKIGVYARENIVDGTGTLKYEKGDLVKTITTNAEGLGSASDLYLGKYYLKEIETHSDHVLDTKEYDFELKYKDQKTPIIEYTTTLDNFKKKSDNEFTKVDSSTSDPLPNTTMELYYVNENKDILIFKGKTDDNGKIVVKNLPQGKYYWLEKEAPEHYVLNAEKLEFEILKNGDVIKSSLENTRYSEFTLTKTNLSGTETVPGATIEIYKVNEDESEELFYEGLTDESGEIYVDEIPIGNYYFIETKAPDNYQINEEKHPFTVNENGIHYEATISNEKYSTVTFYKKDLSDETKLLAGATICVYKEDGTELACLVTNEEGYATMQLTIGKYYYKETIAPENYEIDPEVHYFEVTQEGSTFAADVYDKFIVIEVPKTDITTTPLIVGVIGAILGCGILLFSKKKK